MQRADTLTHMLLNVTVLVLFIIHTGSWDNPSGEASGIIPALLGVLCTVGTGYFGWTVMQTYHVGVQLKPDQERLARGARTA